MGLRFYEITIFRYGRKSYEASEEWPKLKKRVSEDIGTEADVDAATGRAIGIFRLFKSNQHTLRSKSGIHRDLNESRTCKAVLKKAEKCYDRGLSPAKSKPIISLVVFPKALWEWSGRHRTGRSGYCSVLLISLLLILTWWKTWARPPRSRTTNAHVYEVIRANINAKARGSTWQADFTGEGDPPMGPPEHRVRGQSGRR